jgi:DNA (cytosine-5)-methyltransferase 1
LINLKIRMTILKVNIPWTLSDYRAGLVGAQNNGLKVFSTFSCGGGSSMGYKLAGFNIEGFCEIDPKMASIYIKNHNPKYRFIMPIQDFKTQVPKELIDIDILDGSPPCSVFSMAGNREGDWGKVKAFREGQSRQRLDDLFFHFIDLASVMKPKVIIAENVTGLVKGGARGYVKEILREFNSAGYIPQLFQLNSSRMGVPQSRERVFFVARRNDLILDSLQLEFKESPISVIEAIGNVTNMKGARPLEKSVIGARDFCIRKQTSRVSDWKIATTGKSSFFNHIVLLPFKPSPTQIAGNRHIHWAEDRRLSDLEVSRLQSFPDDYDYCGEDAGYVCGMSVPPLMMQRLALEVGRQWFKKTY